MMSGRYRCLCGALALVVSLGEIASGQEAASVQWTDLVDATVTGDVLHKTAGCDGCPAGAHSIGMIESGDGYAEFTPVAGHRLFAGLGTTRTASVSFGEIEFAFSFWADGGWDVRENGIYRTEGRFIAGDRFRVAVEAGLVKYYRNGALVFTSGATPAYPLIVDVSLLSPAAAVQGAALFLGASTPAPPPPPPPPPSDSTPTVNPGPYDALTDRLPRPKPTSSAPNAGVAAADETFGSRLLRVTDGRTRPGALERSYTSPSSSHQNAWNITSRYFYIVSTDGTVLPFAFDPATMTARRIHPSPSGDGGLTLRLGGEPQFSFVQENILYGVYYGPGANLHTVVAYDFATDTYSPLLDLETVVGGLAGTYVGGLGSSAGPVERIAVFYGGEMQGRHRYVTVFDRTSPASRRLLDTVASTVDGAPTNIPLNFHLHAMFIDKSGQYVMVYPPGSERQPPRNAAPAYLWDLAANQFTELPSIQARVGGHDGFGYGYLTNQDCCATTTWDAAQWQLRSFAAPFTTYDLIVPVLTPKEVALADHQSWTHAQPSALVPVVSATYRVGSNTTEWRAWDDEIIAVQTDAAMSGRGATVWRFAHHRSNVANDNDPSGIYFWYTPRAIVSPDGRWAMFTSNWDKTLGIDSLAQPGGMYRQDVFVVELKMLDDEPAPLAVATAALPDGRTGTPYSAALAATGGVAPITWSLAEGALPAGLQLDSAGAITGSPRDALVTTFTVAATDSAATPETARQTLSLTVNPPPVRISTTSLPTAVRRQPYAATLSATGGSAPPVWTLESGSLPPELTLSADGSVSGIPSRTGSFTFTVRATDPNWWRNTEIRSLTIVVDRNRLSSALEAPNPPSNLRITAPKN